MADFFICFIPYQCCLWLFLEGRGSRSMIFQLWNLEIGVLYITEIDHTPVCWVLQAGCNHYDSSIVSQGAERTINFAVVSKTSRQSTEQSSARTHKISKMKDVSCVQPSCIKFSLSYINLYACQLSKKPFHKRWVLLQMRKQAASDLRAQKKIHSALILQSRKSGI